MAKTPKVIRAQTIMSLFRSVLDPNGTRHIDFDAPITKYVMGGAGAVRSFANRLNKSPQFKGYGLSLVPGDMADVATVEDVGAVIIAWFQQNNWRVRL